MAGVQSAVIAASSAKFAAETSNYGAKAVEKDEEEKRNWWQRLFKGKSQTKSSTQLKTTNDSLPEPTKYYEKSLKVSDITKFIDGKIVYETKEQ